jgi:rhodanese-related sulfurtransferase
MSTRPGFPRPVPPPPVVDPATGLPLGWNFRPEHEVTPRSVHSALTAHPQSLVLLDCRRDEEWAFNRLDHAVHIPMDQIERRIDEVRELADQVAADATHASATPAALVVYCHHGVRSLRVTMMLQAMGIKHARSMAGGIDLWSADINPAIERY